MLSVKIQPALNDQINNEFYAAYLYLSMAGFFQEKNLSGFAHWMRLQREEEIAHGMKIFDFVYDRDGRVELGALEQPQATFDSPLDVMERALEHEREVTAKINELYELAVAEKDYSTQALLQWFILEQVEEEASALQIVEQLRMIGDSRAALLMLDRELGSRTAAQ
ncbi:MAG TPA: ferritin [Gemmatimonadota bacterium]|nr:ferritin [Gemmatimonadota bacterium]